MFNIAVGVRGRLLFAFSGISALAALGAVAALWTFGDVERDFERITRERVPTTLAALDLSRQAERIAALAPRILADEATVEQLRTDRIVRRQIALLEQRRGEVKVSRSNPLLISEIEKEVTEIRKNLSDLQTLREVMVASSLDDPSVLQRTVEPKVKTTAPGVLIPLPRDELLSRGQKVIQSNIEATERLATAVDRVIEDEKQQMAQAEANVAATQRYSTFVLVSIVALSLVSSALIVWLYVGRSIVGRLTALSGSMLAIAGGNLHAPLPKNSGSKDEITSMGDALRLFREKAVENERLHRLKSFLAPQVAELIVSSGDESVLNSHRRDVAVLFCDLRGFTAFAESAEPEEIMDFLQQYHESLGQLVDKYVGTLERFTGDGLIVLFNDPLPSPEPCLAATRLAVDMRSSVNEVIERRRGGNRLGFGVGIAYGYATLGRIGFKGRFDYTAIGSVVNLAARLCERAQAGQILVDSNVHAEIASHMEAKPLGAIALKGFSRPVEVFNVLADQ